MFTTAKRGAGLLGMVRTLFSTASTEIVAVDDVSFTIPRGQIVGLIGPNGAGKSTTVKMLTGILHPSSGSISIMGRDPFRERVANNYRIGAVFGQRSQLWWDLPARESFALLAEIYEVPAARFADNMARFSEVLGLEPYLTQPVRKLSLGQKMACDIAASLLHDPDVVYLDEPTIGLDVSVKERIRSFILDVNAERRTTILLTTHDLGDIERLAQRVLLIDHGRIVFDGQLEGMRARFGDLRTASFDLSELCPEAAMSRFLAEMGPRILHHSLESEGHRLELEFSGAEIGARELVTQVMERFPVRDFSLTYAPIEEIIRKVYEAPLP